jgi:hypothetical protein
MRFFTKEKRMPKVGDKRIVKYFALLPVEIDGETRWLESVEIKKEFKAYYHGLTDGVVKQMGKH